MSGPGGPFEPRRIAIIGAGIIGVSTAIWLQRQGHRVILIDKTGVAAGASQGNGGVLASASIIPVTVPGLLGKAPRMLLDADQPLFLKWGYLPRLLPWLMRYMAHANAADVNRIATALHGLTGDSLADHQALAAGTGAEGFIVPCPYRFLYRDRAAFEADRFGWSIRKAHGFVWDELEGDALRAVEPMLSPGIGFAASLDGHGMITDPEAYVRALADHALASGGELRIAAATDIVREEGRVTGVRAGGETIGCDAVVIACGAWSVPLAARLGLKVPLESERGYHLELWEPSMQLGAPVMVVSGKFVATPMQGRLRLAGIVEFGGLEAPASRPPLDLLMKGARQAFPGLTWRYAREWMGHRPAPSDSIPLIGPVPGAEGAYVGFGHHHVGMTAGPKTGRLLAQMISGQRPNLDVAPYAPLRFQ
ncbi:glycine/D-amino acid oxidase-like deaminating enzyme [Hoeflea marina]|uniref:Glycine/D-amino acid oxidase-like deaminating enzyme n=1 Tax=Hoeflea marina TaxID=274592 RepID=A0A317PH52_9HYPH|nr:FAD-binding oxidoreductase [Hoeflea marina]PWV98912.1 glycine/D-amino acid oxidase-like deaminating enzyme [Hoeflea marina]